MKDLEIDFLKEIKFIVKDEDKYKKLKNLVNNYFIRCAENFEIEEAVLILDENLNITDSDDTFNKWFKIDKNYLLGKKIYEIFPEEFQKLIKQFFEKLNQNKKYKFKNFLVKINNIEEYVNIKGEFFRFKKENCYYLTFTKKIIETNIYKLKKIEEEIANLVLRVKDFKNLMKETLKIFVDSGLFDLGWVAKIDKESKRIIPIITLNEEKEDIEFKKRVFDFNYFQEILDMLIEKEEIFVNNIKFQGKKYVKGIVFPIFRKWDHKNSEETEYAVLIYSKKDFNFDEDEKNLFKEIIYKLNIAIADIFIKKQNAALLLKDVLTNLPKRELFIDKIDELIKDNIPFAIVIIDINKLKKINSVLGFWAGDKAIKKVADYLQNNLEKSYVYRIGGDEFGVIIKREKYDVFKILDKISQFNNKILNIDENEIYLSISAGVAFYPDDSTNTKELIMEAEEALDNIKKKGGKGIAYANKNINIPPKDYLELEKELKEAIEKDEYVMYYQPIIDIHKNKVWGAEALIRWDSKKRGLVPPGKFIPILEESGLINEVGDIIIEKVLNDIKEFENKKIHFIISMNVSGVQLLSQDLAIKLINRIEQLKVNKKNIIIEITESVLMENIEAIMPQIRLLQEEGIKIEIDDFGTGYSSLAYLKQLPVSALKIDRAFIKDILTDKESKQIVKAIISMSKALHKKTIAEGAETKEVVNELKKLRVDYIQGYYFAKPMPKKDLKDFIEKFNSK